MANTETEKFDDYARTIDIDTPGFIEDLVRAQRSPVLVPHRLVLPRNGEVEERDVVYCHIPPRGTRFKDHMSVNRSGDVEFFDLETGESKGKTIFRLLKPEEGERVKERRNAELRAVSRERREKGVNKNTALIPSSNT